MHAIFIAYGTRDCVNRFLQHIEAQFFRFPMWKGKKKKEIGIYCAIRMLPMGAYEVIFPREYKDKVLSTLLFDVKQEHYVGKVGKAALRRMYKAKWPKFKRTETIYPWDKQHVSIIPIGIKEDGDITDAEGRHKGWTHEAL